MAAKVFEKSAEETAFRAVLKEVYESGKNSVAVLWADAALSARFQETLYALVSYTHLTLPTNREV